MDLNFRRSPDLRHVAMRRTGEAIKDRVAFVNAFFKLYAQFSPVGPDEFQQRFSGIALAELTPAGKDAASATLMRGFFSPDPVKVEFRSDAGQWKIEGLEPVDPNAEPQFAVLRDVKRRRGLVHITGRVASPEYALHGGTVTLAFVAVFADTRADDERRRSSDSTTTASRSICLPVNTPSNSPPAAAMGHRSTRSESRSS